MTITESEILQTIAAAMGSSPLSAHGMTGPEIAKALGVGVEPARQHIRRLIAAGTMERCQVERHCLDGRTRHTPAYRMKVA